MKISLNKKIALTVMFITVYLILCLFAQWLVGSGMISALVSALLALPFAWMVTQTWSDD